MSVKGGRTPRVALFAAAALALPLGGALASPSLQRSLGAAYRAFRDPSLLDAPARAALAPLPAPPITLAPMRSDAEIDADLAREFAQAEAADFDDQSGVSLAELALPDLRVPVTRRTLRYVRFFTGTPAGRAAFSQRLYRYGRYRAIVEPALREAGLPDDLAWVAAVESGFDPRAASPAGAVGMWQFMPETARAYGLEQSSAVDERRSLTRSTAAAAAHLRDLHDRFGRWDLALAAYNAGAERVLEAIDHVLAAEVPGQRRGPVGFSDLAARRALPEETAAYVPQVAAFAIVAANRSRFGFDASPLAPPIELAEIAVPAGTRLATLARAAGVPTSVLRDHNPEVLLDRVPESGGDYVLHVPADRVAQTLATFPAYSDQEVLHDDAGDLDAPDPTLPIAGDAAVALGLGSSDPGLDAALVLPGGSAAAAWVSLDDPMPRRPSWLGRNRLPFFAAPGTWSMPIAVTNDGELAVARAGSWPASPMTKLAPPDLIEGRLAMAGESAWSAQQREGQLRDVGSFRGESVPDAPASRAAPDPATATPRRAPPGVLPAPASVASAPASQAAACAPLEPVAPPTIEPRRFTLASGVAVELLRDLTASDVTFTVRVIDPEGGALGAFEAVSSLHVGKRDLDVGAALVAARLRAATAESSGAVLSAFRRVASEPRRRELVAQPYGAAWLALGDALFPAGHPLEGTVLGLQGDARAALDALLVEAMRSRSAGRRAVVQVQGAVDEERLRPVLEAAVGSLDAPVDLGIAPHPRDERVNVPCDGATDTRALTGWIAPAEGDPRDASMRVAMELLIGKRSRLRAALVDREHLAASIRGALDLGPRASVAAIEIAPAVPHDLGDVEAALRRELDVLGDEGPTAAEIALAKHLLEGRLRKEQESAAGHVLSGAPRAANSARVRLALAPDAIDSAIRAIREVTPKDVRDVVARVLSSEHRVVVVASPHAPAILR